MSQSDPDAGHLLQELPSADEAFAEGSRLGRIWLLGLGAAVVAGLIGWGVGEAASPFFSAPPLINDPTDPVHSGPPFAGFIAASRDVSLTWGTIGGLLGLGLGMAGAIASARPRSIAFASAIGAATGAILGALPSLAAFPHYWDYKAANSTNDEFLSSLAIHAASWAPLGLAGGLALGLGLGGSGATRPAKAAIGGLIGALMGVFVYELLGAFALPYDAVASQAVPEAPYARLIGVLATTIGAVAGAILVLTSRPSPGAASHPEAAP